MKASFSARVYDIVKQIPKGRVATYQDIAAFAGSPKASRAVGTAMKHNPDKKTIPCHRVVGSDGTMHGYAFGGTETKMQTLQKEGVSFIGNRVDLRASRWSNRYTVIS